jgi:hypothetical protein
LPSEDLPQDTITKGSSISFPNIPDDEIESFFMLIRQLPVRTVNKIPYQCLAGFLRSLIAVTRERSSSIQGQARFDMFAKCILQIIPKEKNGHNVKRLSKNQRQIKSILENIKLWNSGPIGQALLWNKLISNTTSNRPPSSRNVTTSNVKRAHHLISLGRFGDALKCLNSSGIAVASEEVLNSLQSKHPVGLRPTPLDLDATSSLIVNSTAVKRAILSFKPGSAGGKDGFLPQYLWNLQFRLT